MSIYCKHCAHSLGPEMCCVERAEDEITGLRAHLAAKEKREQFLDAALTASLQQTQDVQDLMHKALAELKELRSASRTDVLVRAGDADTCKPMPLTVADQIDPRFGKGMVT